MLLQVAERYAKCCLDEKLCQGNKYHVQYILLHQKLLTNSKVIMECKSVNKMMK